MQSTYAAIMMPLLAHCKELGPHTTGTHYDTISLGLLAIGATQACVASMGQVAESLSTCQASNMTCCGHVVKVTGGACCS